MDTSHHFSLLLILTISFPRFFLQTNPSVNGDTDLIHKTCKTTKYYDFCVSSLQSDTASPEADTKGLAVIMVNFGITNATSSNSYIHTQLSLTKNSSTNDALMKRVLQECADKYSYAGMALKSSLQNLADEEYDYAYMNVMAAGDYPSGCRNAFKRYPKLAYPMELAEGEDGLKQICDVILGIIDSLDW